MKLHIHDMKFQFLHVVLKTCDSVRHNEKEMGCMSYLNIEVILTVQISYNY
jgi:hypothetical protein